MEIFNTDLQKRFRFHLKLEKKIKSLYSIIIKFYINITEKNCNVNETACYYFPYQLISSKNCKIFIYIKGNLPPPPPPPKKKRKESNVFEYHL